MLRTLQRYKDLQDIIAILGIEELTEEGQAGRGAGAPHPALPHAALLRRRAVHRPRAGRYVPVAETVRGFTEILEGKHDDLPENAFYMVGTTIDEAVENAREMAEED